MTDETSPKLVDNPAAPVIYADWPMGVYLTGGVLRITLGWVRPVHTGPAPAPELHSAAVIAIPISGAESLRDLLTDFIERTKREGAGMAAQVPPGSMVN